MSKLTSSHRGFSREFKLEAVRRVLAGEKVSAVTRDLKLPRNDLYVWRDCFLAGGPEAMRDRGRPRHAERLLATRGGALPPQTPAGELERMRRGNAELERKVGQQQLELDFFRQALRQVAGARRPSAGLGVTESTGSSKR
jgi:transposase-like protein